MMTADGFSSGILFHFDYIINSALEWIIATVTTVFKFFTRYRVYSKMHIGKVHCINGGLNL